VLDAAGRGKGISTIPRNKSPFFGGKIIIETDLKVSFNCF